MAATLPTFADLPVVNPRPNGQLPRYPAEDPAIEAQAKFGGALSKAGNALVDVAAYQDLAKTKLEESNATLDLVNRMVPLHTQISTETDPNKIAELRQQYDSLLQISGNAIGEPGRRQAWAAKHASTILHAHSDADKRLTLLDREQVKADGLTRLDALARTAAASDDPNAVAGAMAEGQNNLEWQQRYGSMSPLERRAAGKQFTRQLLESRAAYLINRGRPDEARDLIDQNADDLDPVVAERLRQSAETKGSGIRVSGAANRALGLAPALPPRTSGGMQVGGAIGERVAQTLRNRGWSEPAIVGALNNSLTESSWNPTATGEAGERGLFQFHPRTHLPAFRASYGGDFSPEAQANYVADAIEKDMPEYPQIGDPRTATARFLRGFERPKDQGEGQLAARLANTSASLAALNGGGAREARPAATSASFDLSLGDSIAVQQIKHGLGGTEAPFKSEGLGPEGSTARVGDSPQQVLDRIKSLPPETFAGKTIFLSPGTSNNPDQVGYVGDQIDALKKAGAAAVVVPGVGPGIKNAAALNKSLQGVVEDRGGVFFQPDIKWQKDGVHPAEVDKVRAQAAAKLIQARGSADQIVGQPQAALPPPAAVAQQPQGPNRTGLPPLSDAWQRISADPGLRNDQERYQAFQHAKIMYDAQEADLARSERLAVIRQKQAMEQAITEYQKDAYSDTPTKTARDIIDDPRFNGDPKLREHMIAFINNPPGSGIPAPQSYAAAQRIIDRIRLPEGDPNKITSENQIYDNMRLLNRDDLNFVLGKFKDLRSPGESRFSHRLEEFFKGVTPQIDRSGILPGLPQDARGKAKAFEYRRMVEDQIAQYREAGKNPDDLLNPKKPDYLGAPEILKPFRRTFTEALADFQTENNGPLGAQATDLSTPDKLKAAVAGGQITREQGEAEALRRGWIRPAPVPEGIRPDLMLLGR